MYRRIFYAFVASAILILLFSFSSHPELKFRPENSVQGFRGLVVFIDSTDLDTLSLDEMKKMTMDDVDSVTVNPERTRAFVKLKNGKHYVVIISDNLRKTADAKYGSQRAQTYRDNKTEAGLY